MSSLGDMQTIELMGSYQKEKRELTSTLNKFWAEFGSQAKRTLLPEMLWRRGQMLRL